MTWRQRLLDKWPYKVAAVALAMLLWVNVTDEELQVQALRTQVVYDLQDDRYILMDAPDEIRTSFSGRRADLVSLNFNPPTLRIPIAEVTDTVMEVEVSLSAVTYETGTGFRPVGVSPSTLRLRFEPVTRKRLPVYAVAQLEPADGFVILGRPGVEPDSVDAFGPASQVESLASLSTEAVDAPPLQGSLEREVSVAVSPDLEDVRVDPTSVLVRVEVDSVVQRKLLIALSVQGAAAGDVLVSTDSVMVTLDGPHREVQPIGPADITATVTINLAPNQPIAIPVQLTLPDGLQVSAVVEGPEVVARRREDSTD
jgi:YbbR domain-containing protein